LLYEYCQSRSIPHKAVGKLIVATSEVQRTTNLHVIKNRANINGVHDLKWLSTEDVKILEPEVRCGSIANEQEKAALFSPSTGIIDSHSLMTNFLADAETNGAVIAHRSTVRSGSFSDHGITLDVDGYPIHCQKLINCGGLDSANVASSFSDKRTTTDFDVKHKSQGQYFAKGNYFRLESQKTPFNHLVYPVPEKAGLGVHATLDLGNQCRFGPDVEWINADVKHSHDIDLTVDPGRAIIFYESIRRYWPFLLDGSLAPDYSGIRPKRFHPDVSVSSSADQDFLIEGPKEHGINGFVNLIGIESPGLTSCMAIAEHVYNTSI